MRLGQKVAFTVPLRRVSESLHTAYSDRKVWRPNLNYRGPVEGILIGIRTLTNGVREHMGEDGCSHWPDTKFRAALVAVSLRLNRVIVALDDIHEIE